MGLRHALTFALAAALAALPATAQTVYKLIDRNGKVTYSETPPKNFDGKVIRIDIDPNANRATLGKGPANDPGEAKGRAEAKEKQQASRAERLEQAKRKLEAARTAFEDARDNPAESDFRFLGNVGGGVRRVPTEAYQERLARLERAVKEAEDEVQELEK